MAKDFEHEIELDVGMMFNTNASEVRKELEALEKQKDNLEKPIKVQVDVDDVKKQLEKVNKDIANALKNKSAAFGKDEARYTMYANSIKELTVRQKELEQQLISNGVALRDIQTLSRAATVETEKLEKATKKLEKTEEKVSKKRGPYKKTSVEDQNKQLLQQRRLLQQVESETKRLQDQKQYYAKVQGGVEFDFIPAMKKAIKQAYREINEDVKDINNGMATRTLIYTNGRQEEVDLADRIMANKAKMYAAYQELMSVGAKLDASDFGYQESTLNGIVRKINAIQKEYTAAQKKVAKQDGLTLVPDQTVNDAEKIKESVQDTTSAIEEQASALEAAGDASKNAADSTIDAQQETQKEIQKTNQLINNQKSWLKSLGNELNKDNFKTSGKKQATEQLRSWTARYVDYMRNQEQRDSAVAYAKEKMIVGWNHAYQEAQSKGVANSILTRYQTGALSEYDYKTSLETLQEVYSFREQLLQEHETKLVELQNQLNNTPQMESAIEDQEKLTAEIKNTEKSAKSAATAMQEEANALESVKSESSSGVFREQLSVAQQTTEEYKKQNQLLAMHGTSAKNLISALKKGAFSSPSIAVTKPDVYSGGYGDATVVFKQNAIDPKLNPANKIYGVDAYTPTHPSFGYDLDESGLIKASERTGIAIERLRYACDGAYENITDAVGVISSSTGIGDALKEAYIKERGFKIEESEIDDAIKNRFHVLDEDINNAVRDFIARDDVTFDAIVNDTKLQNEYFAAVDQYVADTNKYFECFAPGQIKPDRVEEFQNTIKKAQIDQETYNTEKELFEHDQAVIRGELKIVDNAARFNEISKIISENRKDYLDYVESVLMGVMIKPNVKGANGQRFDRTPEGIAEAMSSYGGKGALYNEDAFVRRDIGLQAFIIAASKTYENLDEVVLDMARLQKDATGTHTLSNTGYSISGITDVIAKANNTSDEEVFDKILHAVDGNSTADAIGKALRDSGLVVEGSTVQKIAELVQEALRVPTKYFEAKPQRALGLEDIEFVSVPKDSALSGELRAILDEKGINYVEHTSTDETSRRDALTAGMNLQFLSSAVEKTASEIIETGTTAKDVTAASEKLAGAEEKASSQLEKQQDISTIVPRDIINKMLQGVDFEKILTSYGIPDDKLDRGSDLFKDFAGSLYLDNGGAQRSEAIFNEIFDFISNNAQQTEEVVKTLEGFRERMKLTQIRVPENMEDEFAAEFQDSWNEIKKTFAIGGSSKNKKKLITTSKYASTADALVEELISEGFGSAFDSKMLQDFNGNPYDALRLLLDAVQRTKDEFKLGKTKTIVGLNDDKQADLAVELANVVNQISQNLVALNSTTENTSIDNDKFTASTEHTVTALNSEASSAENAAEAIRSLQAAEDDVVQGNNEKANIIQRQVDQALADLRNAKDNKTLMIDLRAVDSEDALKEQIVQMANKAFDQQLSVGSIVVDEDVAVLSLYNDELGLTTKQYWQLEKATEDATEAQLKFIKDTPLVYNVKQAQKYAKKQEDSISGSDKWAIGQMSKLNTQERAYKYGSKKISGETALLDIDATSLDQDADKTIDGLASHIRQRLESAFGSAVSNSFKNEIQKDLSALENEIKIQQAQTYTSTTMSASEVESARKVLINTLDELESKAKKNNVFDQLSESLQNLRNRLTDTTVEGYIEDNFTGAVNEVRVLRSELSKAIAVKNEQSSYVDIDSFTKWKSNIKNVGMLTDGTAERIETLRQSLSNLGEGADLGKLTSEFKELQETVKYETTSKQTKDKMSEIKSNLEAQKKELKALYGQIDLTADLGNNAPNAQDIEESYLKAVSAIDKCTKSIGDQTQEEIAGATVAANAAKEKINAFKEVQDQVEAARRAEEQATGKNAVKQYYQELNSTIQQIANLDSKINNLKLKDNGSGAWSSLIDSLDMQREQLLDKVRDTAASINDAFNGEFVRGDTQVDLPFSSILRSLNDEDASSTIENFFNDFRVQESLTAQSIDNFVSNLQSAQNKAEEFAVALAEKLSSISESANTLSKLGRSGAISTDHELYKGGIAKLAEIGNYKQNLPSDPTAWTADQTAGILKLINELNEYVSALDKAVSKEASYFANKKQYANISDLQGYDDVVEKMDKVPNSTNKAKESLENFVNSFTNGQGIITGFTTSADGISKIDFSVLEEGTNQFRTFSAEMGQFTNNVYTYETSMKNMTAGTDAAQSALASMSKVMSRMNNYGFTVDSNDSVNELFNKMKSLRDMLSELGSSKDPGDQNALANEAAGAERLLQKLAALEKAYLKVNDAMADGDVKHVGDVEKGEDAYEKMAQCAEKIAATMPGSTLAIGQFNEKAKQLPITIETADGEVQTFIMSMDSLSGIVTFQLTSIDKVKTGWEEFGSAFGGLGKDILKYGARFIEVSDMIRYLKQGFNEVLEIDTAMTELRKVTDETSVAYDNFLNNMAKTAGSVGSTVKDLTSSAADWARLGYSMTEAGQLAENTMILMNVSEFDNVSDATDSLISSLQAFKEEGTSAGEYSMKIIDEMNQIGNNYAISTSDLASSLTKSSAALVAANNSLEESIALTTAANTVIQDPDSVGNALKVIEIAVHNECDTSNYGSQTSKIGEGHIG